MRKITITESQFKKLISESTRKLIREAQDYVLIKSIPVSKAIKHLGGDESKLDTLSKEGLVSLIQKHGEKAPAFCSDPDELSDRLFWEDSDYAVGSFEDNMGEQNFVLYAKTNGQPTNMALGFAPINENMNGSLPITFVDYINLNKPDKDLEMFGMSSAEWNANNFICEKKAILRAQDIFENNPDITIGEVEMRIIALGRELKKSLPNDIERATACRTELLAYKLIKNFLIFNCPQKTNLRNVSENTEKKVLDDRKLDSLIWDKIWNGTGTIEHIWNIIQKYYQYDGTLADVQRHYAEVSAEYEEFLKEKGIKN